MLLILFPCPVAKGIRADQHNRKTFEEKEICRHLNHEWTQTNTDSSDHYACSQLSTFNVRFPHHGCGCPAICQALIAATGWINMMTLSVRLSRTHNAQPISITMIAATVTFVGTREANQKPSAIIRMSLKELSTLSPA